jgi:hypothetical protein
VPEGLRDDAQDVSDDRGPPEGDPDQDAPAPEAPRHDRRYDRPRLLRERVGQPDLARDGPRRSPVSPRGDGEEARDEQQG